MNVTEIKASAPSQPLEFQAWRLHQERTRLQFWRSALVGLAAGGMAVLFQFALSRSEGVRTHLLEVLHAQFPLVGWAVLPILAGIVGAFVGWMTEKYAPNAAGSGIPHIKGVLLHARSMTWHRLVPVKFIGGVLCIGSGFSLGREGPTVQMGAAMGRAVAGLLRVPQSARPQLIACGAGAGLAAAFNAPLAGFIFTIEELRRELSPLTYGMSLIAAVVADIVTRTFLGQTTAFHISGYPTPPLSALPLFAVVGLVAGLFGVAFSHGLLAGQRLCDKHIQLPRWQRAGLIGVAIGLVGWWLPEALGTGHAVSEQILRGDYEGSHMIFFLMALFAGKFLLTMISYMAGVPGGIFAPMLLLGAVLGLLVGQISSGPFPVLAGSPAAFAVAGMAAYFAAVVRAPLTGIVLVLEMTGNYEQLFPLLIACMVAYVVAEQLRSKPVYDALLGYDLQRTAPDPTAHQEPMLMEFGVERGAFMDGRAIRDLGFPLGCLIVTIMRGAQEIIPHGKTIVQSGDHVTVVLAGNVSVACHRIHELSRAHVPEKKTAGNGGLQR